MLKDNNIIVCSILISLWAGITAWCLAYMSLVPSEIPNCCFRYFQNPWISHLCSLCRNSKGHCILEKRRQQENSKKVVINNSLC